MPINLYDLFQPNTAEWFTDTLGKPTPVQEEAWPAIAAGASTLVSAPTGTGKTLSAFLVFIDRLKAQAAQGALKQELTLIYVSPLKSLAADIRENLRRPLDGIPHIGERIDVAIRTGDTTQRERRQMPKRPPHILITTPESLYLLLTSRTGQSFLGTAKAVIIDELHALIDTKRGAHMMLSLARLDRLCGRPLQRIGLSATIEPLAAAAAYLSPDPVRIAAPKVAKKTEISVISPFPEAGPGAKRDPIWEELAQVVYRQCQGSRTVIAFAEARRYAEKLAYYVNQIAGDGFARTHHGSLSKEQRQEVEQDLRDGSLRLLCATSSMELGIDVGEIDQVLQIGCPKTISGTMQRLGRAGHNPGRVSAMYMYPRTAMECLQCGLTAQIAREGGVEYLKPPRLCLDVLAQHLVSMAVVESYELDDVMEILPRAWPFAEVTKEDVDAVLRMLSGDYEHRREIPVRPRILYDRLSGKVEGDNYSRLLSVSAGGTIPDKGMYTCKTEEGVKLGELDEEFIYESRLGEKFILGTFGWQIVGMSKNDVIVRQTSPEGARLPFWKGELKGRDYRTSRAFGRIMRRLGDAHREGTLDRELEGLGLDASAVEQAGGYIRRQMAATQVLPDDRTILVEHFKDTNGIPQVMVHALFGRRVNAPLSLLVQQAVYSRTNATVGCVDDEDGFMLFPYGKEELPEGLLFMVPFDRVRQVLEAVLPSTSIYNMTFRYNAARALMMGIKSASRQPLWLQRMRSAQMMDDLLQFREHPLVRETRRECLEDLWDIGSLERVLQAIRSGDIAVREVWLDSPSPMSLPFQWNMEAAVLYDYSPTPRGVYHTVEEELKAAEMIEPAKEALERAAAPKKLPEDEKQLHSLLMIEGDLVAGELAVPIEWLEALCENGQAAYIEPGLWIAAEQAEEYRQAWEEDGQEGDAQEEIKQDARRHIVRRLLYYRGARSAEQVAERYFISCEKANRVLEQLCGQEEAVENGGIYYHAKLYDKARRETIKAMQEQIRTQPPEKYAALLAGRMTVQAPPSEQVEKTMRRLAGCVFPAANWESVIFPARVKNYRENLLDAALAKGEYFWRLTPEGGLAFWPLSRADWDADLSGRLEGLTAEEQAVYEALLRRGASFMQSLSGVLSGKSPHETLLSLAGKGLVCADSFMPVRQWLNRDKLQKAAPRQRINARVMALQAGRWDVVRPVTELTVEEQMEHAFERFGILCRETALADGLSWTAALQSLRVWEYTGRARRGYFIEGLSGAQFIREKDFGGTMAALGRKEGETVWLPAAEPSQAWGKWLAHREGRSFMNVPGTAVALRDGETAAVLERQGKTLRFFIDTGRQEILDGLVHDFKDKRLFPGLKRMILKEYPPDAASMLQKAGFLREMQDYVLYR